MVVGRSEERECGRERVELVVGAVVLWCCFACEWWGWFCGCESLAPALILFLGFVRLWNFLESTDT